MSYLNKSELSQKLSSITPEQINSTAEHYAEIFAREDKLKTAQLRNFYASVTRMRTDFEHNEDFSAIEMELVMLKPKLAYAAGRQKAVRNNFYEFMKNAIDGVSNAPNKPDAMHKFFRLVESVVAYHKFYGDV